MEAFVSACYNSLNNWANIIPPNSKVLETFIRENERLMEIVKDEYTGNEIVTGNEGLDTCIRDILFDEIGFKFAGESWPLNMDSDEKMLRFSKNLKIGLQKEGWMSY